MKTNVMIDETFRKKLPRSIGYSGLLRWALHVAVDTEKEFNAGLLRDPGLAAANQYMAARVRKMFVRE